MLAAESSLRLIFLSLLVSVSTNPLFDSIVTAVSLVASAYINGFRVASLPPVVSMVPSKGAFGVVAGRAAAFQCASICS